MREYPDLDQYMKASMHASAEKYVRGLQRAGLEPNNTLIRALAEMAVQEARGKYIQQLIETRDHNIRVILNNHRRRMNEIKREGAKLYLKICLPVALLFGLLACYSFAHAGTIESLIGGVYSIACIVVLAVPVLGTIFERLRK